MRIYCPGLTFIPFGWNLQEGITRRFITLHVLYMTIVISLERRKRCVE